MARLSVIKYIFDVNDFVVPQKSTMSIPTKNINIRINMVELTELGKERMTDWMKYPNENCPFSITCGVCEEIFEFYNNSLHKDCPCMIYGVSRCVKAGGLILKYNNVGFAKKLTRKIIRGYYEMFLRWTDR